MLGKSVINNIEKWDYTKQRATFLSFSAGFRILIQHVRKKHDLANKKKEFNKTTHTYDFMTLANNAYPKIKQDVKELASFFHMSELFIGDALIGLKDLHLAESWIVRIVSPDDPLIEAGFYIRVDQATPLPSVIKAFHEIKDGYKLMGQSTMKKIQVREKRNRKLNNLADRLKMYECIEKFIHNDYLRKQEKVKDELRSGEIYNPESLVLEGIRYYSEELTEKGKKPPPINTLNSRYYEIYSYFNIPSFQVCMRISF